MRAKQTLGIASAIFRGMNRVLVATLCAFLGTACTPSTEPGAGEIPGCEGKCDGIGDFAPVAGPESLIHCELTSTRDVVCDYTGVPDSFPVGVTVDVTALGQGFRDSNGRLQSGQLASTEFQEPGRVTLLGALPSDQLPVTLIVNLEMRADFLVGNQNSSRTDLRSMSHSFRFDSAGDETPDLGLPLEFWPVRLFAAEGGNVRNPSAGPQSVDIAPWDFFIGESAVDHSFDLPMIEGEPQEFLLPVAPGLTTLNARGTYCGSDFGCDEVAFVFNGPGIYALSGDGAATFEPPAGVDGGPGIDGSTDSGPGIDGGTDGGVDGGPGTDGGLGFDGGVGIDGGSPDAGPPPCGTSGQRPCADGTCAENNELDGEFCYPCGVDGEARCSGESGCAEGHRLQSNVCRACGADGQVACWNGSDNVCDEGHRLRNGSCLVCGSDGQIACWNGSENVCDDGHRVRNGSCLVCGSDGEIACWIGSENVCDDGHRLRNGNCLACGYDGLIACWNGSQNVCNDGFRVSSGLCVPE